MKRISLITLTLGLSLFSINSATAQTDKRDLVDCKKELSRSNKETLDEFLKFAEILKNEDDQEELEDLMAGIEEAVDTLTKYCFTLVELDRTDIIYYQCESERVKNTVISDLLKSYNQEGLSEAFASKNLAAVTKKAEDCKIYVEKLINDMVAEEDDKVKKNFKNLVVKIYNSEVAVYNFLNKKVKANKPIADYRLQHWKLTRYATMRNILNVYSDEELPTFKM